MDHLTIVAGAVLAVMLAGAFLVEDDTAPPPAQVLDFAVCGQDHAAHGAAAPEAHAGAMAEGRTPAHAELAATMGPMHADMARGLMAPEFDAAFLCSMIPHHQGAVEMARVALRHGGDPFVTMLAQEIVSTQEREIGEMAGWLARKEADGR